MNTNDIPKAHPSLLDALRRQDEKAQQMNLSEGFEERVMRGMKNEELKSPATPEGNSYFSLFTFHFSLKKIAAIFLAAVFLGGLAWAFVPLLRPKEEASPTAEVTTLPLKGEQGGGLLSFANVRLDSILTVVAGHYGLEVSFRDEAPRELRFTVTWNRRLPIAAFVSSLNEFDGLLLTEERDTLFVESVETKEE